MRIRRYFVWLLLLLLPLQTLTASNFGHCAHAMLPSQSGSVPQVQPCASASSTHLSSSSSATTCHHCHCLVCDANPSLLGWSPFESSLIWAIQIPDPLQNRPALIPAPVEHPPCLESGLIQA